jgi:hypothetical protein
MWKLLALALCLGSVARGDAGLDARAILNRVIENRALKDFSLKARLFAGREQPIPVTVLVKNTPTETRTIYRTGTHDVMIVQPVSGEAEFFLRGGQSTDKLFGSEFTYYDLALPFLHWPDPKLSGPDRVRGRDCYVVEARSETGPYRRVKLWIDREFFALLRVEAFDADDNPVRRLAVTSFKRIGDVWIPRAIECATVPRGQALPAEVKSRLEIYEGDYDAQLPAEWFDPTRFGSHMQ